MRYGSGVRGSLSLTLIAVWLGGCAPSQPPHWAEGGAPLALGEARWEREGGAVELRPDGRVLIDGDLTFVVDSSGRVTDDDHESYALLLPDGQLVGNDDVSLGRIGVSNASAPGAVEAWLSVAPDGNVTYFDTDGERSLGGVWSGCHGPVLRTCTLVTQLVAIASYRAARSGIGIGVGVGVGVGVGF